MRNVLAIIVVLVGAFFLMFRSRMMEVSEASRRNLFGSKGGSRFDRAWDRVILTVVPLLLIAAGLAALLGWSG